MISDDFQKVIPVTNIMYPVTKVKLPEAFNQLEIPENIDDFVAISSTGNH